MNNVTPEALTAFKSVIPVPTVVCHHLSIQPDDTGEFDGRVVCKTPTTQLLRSPQCQCDTLFLTDADIQVLEKLLQDRSVDIHAKQSRGICQVSAYGSHDTVHWYSPFGVHDQNILDKLEWYFSQEGVDIDQPINHAGETMLHRFSHASCIYPRNSLYWHLYPKRPDDVVKWLLANGASLKPDRLGDTPLHNVCQAGAPTELLVILLEAVRENPKILNAQNKKGNTALIEAMCSDYSWSGTPLLFLRAGATIGDGDTRSEYCPLGAVVKARQLNSEKLGLLAHYGLDISQCTSEASRFVRMMNLYHFYTDTETLLYWIKSGLALNGIDDDGQPLLSACFSPFEKESKENSGWNPKLALCNHVLKAAYKYHFPRNIGALKGAISDTLMETRSEDMGKLLKGFQEAFYLIDNTVEMIASNLNDQNKMKLAALLTQARGEHPKKLSLLPFIYQPYKHYMLTCTDAFMDRMEAIFNAEPSDFVKLKLAPDRQRFKRTKPDEGVVTKFDGSHQNKAPQNNRSTIASDIQLYDWLFEHRLTSLRQLLPSHQELHKLICKHQRELVCDLSDENKQLLEELLGLKRPVDKLHMFDESGGY